MEIGEAGHFNLQGKFIRDVSNFSLASLEKQAKNSTLFFIILRLLTCDLLTFIC